MNFRGDHSQHHSAWYSGSLIWSSAVDILFYSPSTFLFVYNHVFNIQEHWSLLCQPFFLDECLIIITSDSPTFLRPWSKSVMVIPFLFLVTDLATFLEETVYSNSYITSEVIHSRNKCMSLKYLKLSRKVCIHITNQQKASKYKFLKKRKRKPVLAKD